MKKFINVLLFCLCFSIFLTGCGKTQEIAEETQEEEEETKPEKEKLASFFMSAAKQQIWSSLIKRDLLNSIIHTDV